VDEKQTDIRAASAEEEARKRRRMRVRALIIGSLAAGGAFQLNGWLAQAHGNRSSKSMVGDFPDVVLTPAVREKIEHETGIKEKEIKEKSPSGGESNPSAKP
jgi:hypothetical protein